jgi:hypothetical protein
MKCVSCADAITCRQLFKTDKYLSQFKYYMNVDADLFMIKELTNDPMVTMEQEGCPFATGAIGGEATGCFEGQKEATLEWAAQHTDSKIYASNVEQLKAGTTVWGGWNLAKVI